MGLIQSYMEVLPQQPPHLYSGIVGRACLLFLASKVDHDVIELPSNWKPADFASHLRQGFFGCPSNFQPLSILPPAVVWLRWCWFKFLISDWIALNVQACSFLWFAYFVPPMVSPGTAARILFFFFLPKTFENLMITSWFIYDSAVRLQSAVTCKL